MCIPPTRQRYTQKLSRLPHLRIFLQLTKTGLFICYSSWRSHREWYLFNPTAVVAWLLNFLATGKAYLRDGSAQTILPHRERSCSSNLLSHPVTVYWHQANQSQHWPCNARPFAGQPLDYQYLSHLYEWNRKKIHEKSRNQTLVCHSQGRHLTTGPTGRCIPMKDHSLPYLHEGL